MTVKSLLFLAVTLLVTSSRDVVAADAPDGFAGMAWGLSKEEVKAEMQKKPGAAPYRGKTPGRIEFAGGTFSERHVQFWGLDFTADNRFVRGAVLLKPSNERDKGFAALKEMISLKYGQPTSNARKDDVSKAVWRFPSNPQIIIELSSHPDGPKIIYRNDGLEATAPGSKKDI